MECLSFLLCDFYKFDALSDAEPWDSSHSANADEAFTKFSNLQDLHVVDSFGGCDSRDDEYDDWAGDDVDCLPDELPSYIITDDERW